MKKINKSYLWLLFMMLFLCCPYVYGGCACIGEAEATTNRANSRFINGELKSVLSDLKERMATLEDETKELKEEVKILKHAGGLIESFKKIYNKYQPFSRDDSGEKEEENEQESEL